MFSAETGKEKWLVLQKKTDKKINQMLSKAYQMLGNGIYVSKKKTCSEGTRSNHFRRLFGFPLSWPRNWSIVDSRQRLHLHDDSIAMSWFRTRSQFPRMERWELYQETDEYLWHPHIATVSVAVKRQYVLPDYPKQAYLLGNFTSLLNLCRRKSEERKNRRERGVAEFRVSKCKTKFALDGGFMNTKQSQHSVFCKTPIKVPIQVMESMNQHIIVVRGWQKWTKFAVKQCPRFHRIWRESVE